MILGPLKKVGIFYYKKQPKVRNMEEVYGRNNIMPEIKIDFKTNEKV